MPAQIALPGVERLFLDEGIEGLEEVRSGDIEGIEAADAKTVEISAPGEIGSQLLEIVDGVDVVDLFGVAQIDAAHRGLGQGGLDLQHRGGFLGGLIGRVAGQGEHLLHVIEVLGADLGEARGIDDVVVAVGQRKPALTDGSDLLCRILFILGDAKVEETVGRPLAFQVGEKMRKLAGVLEPAISLHAGWMGWRPRASMAAVSMQEA